MTQVGRWQSVFAAMRRTFPARIMVGSVIGLEDEADEATGVHHSIRRCGGHLASVGARAAAREAADHRILGWEHVFGREPTDRRFCATAARTRLDRWSHGRGRASVSGWDRIAVHPTHTPRRPP